MHHKKSLLQCVLTHIYNYFDIYAGQTDAMHSCETQNFVNELIVVHVSAHLTMVKSLYRVHVCARRKGGGGEQRSSRRRKRIWLE